MPFSPEQMQAAYSKYGLGEIKSAGNPAGSPVQQNRNPFAVAKPTETTSPITAAQNGEQPSSFSQQHPILSGIGEGLTSMVREPAKAMQQLGTGLGNEISRLTGTSEEDINKSNDILKAGGAYNPAGYGKPVQNLEEAGGVATQAAANLATPFAAAAGPVGLGLQGAALSGGKSMEEDKGAGEVALKSALGGATGAVLGKASEVAGGLVGKGTQYLREAAAPVVEKALPYLSNIPKTFITFAKANPEIILPKMQALGESITNGDIASGESSLRDQAFQVAKQNFAKAKTAAESAYQTGVDAVKERFPNAQGSLEAMRGSLRALSKEAGPTLTTDEEKAFSALEKIVYGHEDPSLDGFIGLKRQLSQVVNGTEQGTPAHRVANLMTNEVDNELSRMTEGSMKPINKAYAAFKKDALQVKPVWSSSVKEDSGRNFVQNLENQAKGGSLDAMKRLEKLGGVEKSVTDEIKANKIARAFNWEKAPPGSRMRDMLMTNLTKSAGGAIGGAALGGALGGKTGAEIGAAAGAGSGIALSSPAMLSRVFMSQFEKEGVPVAEEGVRQWVGKMLADPKTALLLRNTINGLVSSGEQQQNQ